MDTYRLNAHIMYMHDNLPLSPTALRETRFELTKLNSEYDIATSLLAEQRQRLFSKLNEKLLKHGVDIIPDALMLSPTLRILGRKDGDDSATGHRGVEITEIPITNVNSTDKVMKVDLICY